MLGAWFLVLRSSFKEFALLMGIYIGKNVLGSWFLVPRSSFKEFASLMGLYIGKTCLVLGSSFFVQGIRFTHEPLYLKHDPPNPSAVGWEGLFRARRAPSRLFPSCRLPAHLLGERGGISQGLVGFTCFLTGDYKILEMVL